MAKAPYLTPQIKQLIREIYRRDRQIRPVRARELLLKKMREQGLHEIFGSDYPSMSTVSNKLKEFRDKDGSRSPESKGLDEAWSLSSLPDYPMPPEALPVVASILEKCVAASGGGPHYDYWCLTIREALWVARLYKVIEFYYYRTMERWANPANAELLAELVRTHRVPANYREISLEDVILDWAYAMANEEESAELSDDPSDRENIGDYIIGNIFEYHDERRRDFIDGTAEEYGIHGDKRQELESMPIKDVHAFFQQQFSQQLAKQREAQDEGSDIHQS